ncbi:MAG TPA: hypothetical protein VHE53_03220 [Patescibacteria group bacterium]|nr:hypothetical protein [Patescibacteria group bacterium]
MDKLLALQIPGEQGPVQIQAPQGIPSGSTFTIGSIATSFIQLAMVIGIFMSMIYLAYGGFYWVQSKGDKQTLDKARRILTYAIIGLIIMSISLVIVNVVTTAFGVKSLIGGGN